MRDCFNSFPKDCCVYLCWEALLSAIAGHTARMWENNCKYHFKFTTQITVQEISKHFQKIATIIEAISKRSKKAFFAFINTDSFHVMEDHNCASIWSNFSWINYVNTILNICQIWWTFATGNQHNIHQNTMHKTSQYHIISTQEYILNHPILHYTVLYVYAV